MYYNSTTNDDLFTAWKITATLFWCWWIREILIYHTICNTYDKALFMSSPHRYFKKCIIWSKSQLFLPWPDFTIQVANLDLKYDDWIHWMSGPLYWNRFRGSSLVDSNYKMKSFCIHFMDWNLYAATCSSFSPWVNTVGTILFVILHMIAWI